MLPAGFEWIVSDDTACSVFAWQRKSRDGRAPCVVVLNFTPQVRYDYHIKVPRAGRWREILNSDAAIYGGGNVGNGGGVASDAIAAHGYAQSIALTVPPLGCVMLKV